MKSLYKKLMICLCILLGAWLPALVIINNKGKVQCKQAEVGYEAAPFDKKYHIIEPVDCAKEPGIEYVTDEIKEAAGAGITVIENLNNKGRVVCRQAGDGYEIVLYGEGYHIIETMRFPREPGIVDISDDITEVSVSCGSPCRYVFYFNKKNLQKSDLFFNPILIQDKYIAYMEDGDLVVRDLFHEGILDKRISRDFSRTANPGSAIRELQRIELTGNEYLVIEYLEGEDYKEVIEVIPLSDQDILGRNG